METALPRPALVVPTTADEVRDAFADFSAGRVVLGSVVGRLSDDDGRPRTGARPCWLPTSGTRCSAFVTEDPTRDTAVVLRKWLDRFDTDFTRLIGAPRRLPQH